MYKHQHRCRVGIKRLPSIRINDAGWTQLARGLVTDYCNSQIVSPAAINLARREMRPIQKDLRANDGRTRATGIYLLAILRVVHGTRIERESRFR